MKFSESWLREWVNPKITREELCQTLTMAGLEVEECIPVADTFTGVLIGQVTGIQKHPEADRLQVCEVNVGKSKSLSIVCGASNVKVGMKVPVAMIGAQLPADKLIKATQIRNVPSEGMLCSASELGLSDDHEGLLELPIDAPVGKDLWTFLQLGDYIIDLSITPNRGDCLSIKGVAREVATLTNTSEQEVKVKKVKPTKRDILTVKVTETAGCPIYVGRIIRNVKADAETPTWLKERLRRSGVRSISPIVDVTNYVMLELGQPMHAFDLQTIAKGVEVRKSKQGEKIALLDGSEKILNNETMLIADHEKPLAIAGVMGGLDSSVTLLTRDIFLESAYFSPPVIAKQRQYYQLSSDSAYRFERGIDPTIQREAIERATQLILEIAGGEVAPITEVIQKRTLPKALIISLPHEKITQVLGIAIPQKKIERIFKALKFKFQFKKQNWQVHVPPYRSDITLAEDVIEEIARVYGYDNIPMHTLEGGLQANQSPERAEDLQALRQTMSDQGFHEIISYSFINQKLQSLLDPEVKAHELVNPITADMTVMRTNLWPGLINTLLYNKARQQHRIRLFEIGTCFIHHGKTLQQSPKVAGLITGLALPEQWGNPSRKVDFYDLKGHLENVFKLSSFKNELSFKPDTHPALHPGQTAGIYYHGKRFGMMGALHPAVQQKLDILDNVFVFELDLNVFSGKSVSHYQDISKFPEIRRDIAILVNQAIPAEVIQDTIKATAGDWLKDVFIFDVYQGKGISTGLKSVALALVLQHPSRTLVDDEVAALIERVVTALKGQLGAELRS